MIGHITNIRDFGTIVQVTVEMGREMQIVNFDHRPFSWFMEGVGVRFANDLIGTDVSVADDGLSLCVLDDPEIGNFSPRGV